MPAIYRNKVGFKYLNETLQSIVQETSTVDRQDLIILIFLSDFKKTLKDNMLNFLMKKYKSFFESGFMQIMQIKKDLYPKFTHLKHNYNDTDPRVKWRSKQAVDFAFMFYYGKTLSEYYLQIEDDVICATNFSKHIKEFILSQKLPWVSLRFSTLGFIGKQLFTHNICNKIIIYIHYFSYFL